jgi:hypothetical protein
MRWTDNVVSVMTDGRRALRTLFAYQCLMLVLCLTLMPGGRPDDHEQMYFTQGLSALYDFSNPPLVTWLVYGLFWIFGRSLEVIVGLRIAFLAAFYFFLYGAARHVIVGRRLAVLAALSPLLLLNTNWYVYINYSHTIAMLAMVAASLWCFLHLAKTRSRGAYLLFGLALGIGALTKYNYLLFAGTLLGAALIQAQTRTAVLNRGMLLSLAVMGVLCAPHYLPLWREFDQAMSQLGERFEFGEQGGYLVNVYTGLVGLLSSLLGLFIAPFLVVLALCFGRDWRARGRAQRPVAASDTPRRLLRDQMLLAIGVFLVAVIAFQATKIKFHHLSFLVVLSVLLFAYIEKATPREQSVRRYALTLAGMMALVVILFPLQMWYTARECGKCGHFLQQKRIAVALQQAGFEGGTVLSVSHPHRYAPEMLLLHLPDVRVLSCCRPGPFSPPPTRPGDCAVMWNETHAPGTAAKLSAKTSKQVKAPLPADLEPKFVDVPLNLAPDRRVRIGFAIVKGGVGDCR